MQGARRRPWWYHGQAVQRLRRPSPCQPFGTGQISPHAALSPPYWALPNCVGSALPEGKSAAVAATQTTQTGSFAGGSRLADYTVTLDTLRDRIENHGQTTHTPRQRR